MPARAVRLSRPSPHSAWSKWTLVSFFELLIYFNTVLFPSKFYFKLRTFSTLQLGVDRRFQSACCISEQSRAGRPSTPRGFDVGDRGDNGCRGGSPPAQNFFLFQPESCSKRSKRSKQNPRQERIPLFGKWQPRVAGVKNNRELRKKQPLSAPWQATTSRELKETQLVS